MLKRTPLFEIHQKLGGRLIEFGGWEMPVQYSSIVDEHQAVRQAAGIFDISHMGEVLVIGAAAERFLNLVLTNDLRKLAEGQGQYTLMCNEKGGVIDDLYVYRLSVEEYLLIINASRISEDVDWLQKQRAAYPGRDSLKVMNISDRTGAIAVQGPKVKEFINECFVGLSKGGTPVAKISDLKKNQIARFDYEGTPVWVSRTGYTGEDGFEVVCPGSVTALVWTRILSAGKFSGLRPAGLGARDTLRLEVGYPLYGHELDEVTTPIEAGLGSFVALEKGDFIGRGRLAEQKSQGVEKKCVAFKMTEKSAPPRARYPIWSAGEGGVLIGEVVSGTQSPSLGIGIGMGYVKTEFAKLQTPIDIEIRGKRNPAIIIPKSMHKK